jgi:phytoene/squalene synthetase
VDDVVDEECQTQAERVAFIQRQIQLVERLCRNEPVGDLTPEETIIADLIDHERDESCKLHSYIRNFLAIIEFDAERKGRLISQEELVWYSDRLGVAVTDAIQHFIGHGHPYPDGEGHYLAATAAHIVHMLRDMVEDIEDGYINIPREYLAEHNITPQDVESAAMRVWVRSQIELARNYFSAGQIYLDSLDVLRCKLVGYWYCLRFEGVMKAIEADNYVLRVAYDERHKIPTFLKACGLTISIAVRHLMRRVQRALGAENPAFELELSK